ncbi:ATP-binding protein [Rubrivirga sp. IMCC45206]|uniref:ATP-binding protein n=1 Tax=Rubrivirga sp. IMCC45206 TaxID=3391614 RepID=UPI00398FD841
MTPTLADRLSARRRDQFVGRAAEQARLAEAFGSDDPAFVVAHVYGPGGIGKSALLDEAARLAAAAGRGVARVDGRDVDPSPAAFARAAEAALAAAGDGPRVLLVDTFERIAALDAWLRRAFVPSLGAGDMVVIAGRDRPAPEWHADYAGAAATFRLRNLDADEAGDYLTARGVPEAAHGPVLAFTHGHPLALALAAEQARQPDAGPFDPAQAPDLLADLLTRFVEAVPTPAHRAALEAAAVVRSVTVPVLESLLDDAATDAEAHFAWLRDLTFSTSDAGGVRLHDVVRETVEADVGWRDPARHAALAARARRVYADALRRAPTEDARRIILGDFLHLYRHHPIAGPLLQSLRTAWADAAIDGATALRDGDAVALRAMVARHHGEAEAEAVGGWLAARPEAAVVFRTLRGVPAGFLLTLPLDELSDDECAADPVAAAACTAVRPQLRADERGLLFRSWLDADAGQGVSAVQGLVFARTVECYLTTPRLAASVLLTTQPDLWEPVFAIAGLARWPEAEADGGAAAFGKDWRAAPPDAWLDALAARSPAEPPPPPAREAVVVLSKDDFAEAVRDALRAYARPHRLAESPLAQARVVRERGGDPVEALQTLLSEAARQLADGVRERPYFRALDLTYLHPAPTQAVAAERLDLPFSTFRRHLGRGVDHVVDVLWRAETGG